MHRGGGYQYKGIYYLKTIKTEKSTPAVDEHVQLFPELLHLLMPTDVNRRYLLAGDIFDVIRGKELEHHDPQADFQLHPICCRI
jgi:hypothetical protein